MPHHQTFRKHAQRWFQRAIHAPRLLRQIARLVLTAPRLPEAAGPRHGITGQGPSLRLLIFGDSSAAGVGAATQDQALAGALLQHLAPQSCVHWQIRAKTGLTTRAAMAQLDRRGGFDVVVIALGVNDATRFVRPARWVQQLRQLCAGFAASNPDVRIYLTKLPPLQDFPAVPMPLAQVWGARAARMNRQLAADMPSFPNTYLLDPGLPLHPDLMARDGFHPSAAGYAIWAGALAERILTDQVQTNMGKSSKIANSPLDAAQTPP